MEIKIFLGFHGNLKKSVKYLDNTPNAPPPLTTSKLGLNQKLQYYNLPSGLFRRENWFFFTEITMTTTSLSYIHYANDLHKL